MTLRHSVTPSLCHSSVWIPAGGFSAIEDPERSLADVERDERERMVRLGAAPEVAARIAAAGVERGVVGKAAHHRKDFRDSRGDEEARRGTEGDLERLVALVHACPGVRWLDASRHLGIPPSTLCLVVKRARRRGFLVAGRAGKREGYRITKKGEELARSGI